MCATVAPTMNPPILTLGCSTKLGDGSLENVQTTALSSWSPTARAVWSDLKKCRDPQRRHVVFQSSGA
eukprot:scaffold52636_cov61-Phaeocystis_antarctica.AAC.3